MATQPLGIAGAPTPFPPQGVNYSANQSQPGAIYYTQPAPNSSYAGSSYNSQGQIISTPQNPTIKTPTSPTTTQTQNTPAPQSTIPVSSNPSTDSGFDMKYYPGWDYTAALADWRATGGSKARGWVDPNAKADIRQTNINRVGTDKGGDVALDYQQFADTMSPEEYYAMIDAEAAKSSDFLNKQEASIRADQPGIEQGLLNQYQTGLTSLKGGKESALGKTGIQRQQALSTKEDALSAARRLYNELRQGYSQRFGGASSAGEAARALLGTEQQRQMAGTNRSYMSALSQIGQSESEIENTYNTNLAQLDASRDSALNQAQSEFRNRLLEVDRNRTMVETERMASRRQALQDLANKAFAIQQQRTAFQQQLDLLKAQQTSNLNIAKQQLMDATQTGANALYNFTPSQNPSSTLGQTGITTASGNTGIESAVGYRGTGIATDTRDLLSKGIYPVQSIGGKVRWSDGIVR